MSRVHNFSAGPSALPLEVLIKIQNDLLDWEDSGMSVMEASHRGKSFTHIAEKAESDLRLLLNIPDNYYVLFLQGGATLQFSMVALNLAQRNTIVDYAITGSWGKKAAKEASKFNQVNIVCDSKDDNYSSIIDEKEWNKNSAAAYLHITENETIGGVEYNFTPKSNNVPIVSDMSSSILSREINVSEYGLIYAGAQKNIGPAGLTLVIVRDDLVGQAAEDIPNLMNYKTYVDSGSMSNTPPTFSWYAAGLVFEYLIDIGGLRAIEKINKKKSELLYQYIDQSRLYFNPVNEDYRSRMNIPFLLKDKSIEEKFLLESNQAGLVNLKGHRSVGGMRASIYNAVGIDAVIDLITFMDKFEVKNI
jgi:phosphoserine aminotransferase